MGKNCEEENLEDTLKIYESESNINIPNANFISIDDINNNISIVSEYEYFKKTNAVSIIIHRNR